MVTFTAIFAVAGAILPTVLAAPTPVADPSLDLPFAGVKIINPNAQDIIADHYIVVFKNGTSAAAINSHKKRIQARHLADALPEHSGFKHEYEHPEFNGYSGHFNKRTLQEIAKSDEVEYIEADVTFTGQAAPATTQTAAPWGLDRMSNLKPRSSASTYASNKANTFVYSLSYAGAGATVYSIDSGIRISHAEFEGRASWGYNAIAGSPNTDENGHGTHAAGIVAGKTYGVAKKAKIVAVKVLDKGNTGSTTQLTAGLNWIRNNAKPGLSVVTMSICGSNSPTVNTAVQNLINAGITVVVASGNNNANASGYSPANVATAITVGAVDTYDNEAPFSNFGSAVNLLAPGSLITSAWFASDTASNTMTGTSTATPHVAGLAAYLISQYGKLTPAQMWAKMSSVALNGQMKTMKAGTPNRLAWNNWTA